MTRRAVLVASPQHEADLGGHGEIPQASVTYIPEIVFATSENIAQIVWQYWGTNGPEDWDTDFSVFWGDVVV